MTNNTESAMDILMALSFKVIKSFSSLEIKVQERFSHRHHTKQP